MVELYKTILAIIFTFFGFVLIVITSSSFLIMISNTKKDKSFIFVNLLPVFESKAFNPKGEKARKIYNKTYIAWLLYAALLYISWDFIK